MQHYIAPDLSYIGLKNTEPKDAEVFTPGQSALEFDAIPEPILQREGWLTTLDSAVDAPSGYIIGHVTRDAKAKL